MPPRGVKKGSKRARQYEHIKDSLLERGEVRGHGRGDRRAHRQQGARTPRRGEGVVAALARGHLVRTSGRASLPSQGPARPHEGPALRGGQGQGRQGPLEDDEGRARPCSRRPELTNDVARELLGRSVRADGVCRGTVGAVPVDVRDDVLRMARPGRRRRGGRFGHGGHRVDAVRGDAGAGTMMSETDSADFGVETIEGDEPGVVIAVHGAGGPPHGAAAPRGDDECHRRRCHLVDRRPLRRDVRRLDDAGRAARGRQAAPPARRQGRRRLRIAAHPEDLRDHAARPGLRASRDARRRAAGSAIRG